MVTFCDGAVVCFILFDLKKLADCGSCFRVREREREDLSVSVQSGEDAESHAKGLYRREEVMGSVAMLVGWDFTITHQRF